MAQAAVGKLLGRHARGLRDATRPGETVWRWQVPRGQHQTVFGLVYDADGRVPQANLAGDDRQTQPGG